MRVPTQNALDGGWAVKASCYAAAEGFDAGDCFSGGAGDDDVDRSCELFWVLPYS